MNIFEEAKIGNYDNVKLLLDSGVDVNMVDNNGISALIYSCSRGRIEVVKLLLENMANVNYVVNGGFTALSISIEQGYKDVFEILLKHQLKHNFNYELSWSLIPLIGPCYYGWVDIVRLVLANNIVSLCGCNIAINAMGDIKVHKTIQDKKNHIEIENMLYEYINNHNNNKFRWLYYDK